ncbi:Peptide deformylase [subsurface metagenome]
MYAGKGIGLAAVQVGKLYRIFITHISGDKQRVFINPDILETSVEQDKFEEGCLSVPCINADVIRPEEVTIQAWSDKGKPFSLDAGGLLGRVIQHELDHLNGILFVDRLCQKKKERLIKLYEQQNGE